jgi:hypothetical protein
MARSYRRLVNDGRLELVGNAWLRLTGGEILNRGQLNLRDESYIWADTTPAGANRVWNAGTLVSAIRGEGSAWSQVSVVNEGRVEVQTGTLNWNHRFQNAGHLEIASGAQLHLSGSSTNTSAGSILGAGELRFSAGTHRLEASLAVGQIHLQSGTIDLAAPQEWSDLRVSNGMLTGPAGVRIQGQFTSTGQPVTFGPGAALEIAPAATLTVSTGRLMMNRDLINLGRVFLTNSAFIQPANATLRNRGVMEFTAGSSLFGINSGVSDHVLVNEGQVLLRNTPDPSGWSQVRVENLGRIEVLGGRWNPAHAFINAGELTVGVGTWVQLGSVTTNLPSGRITGPGRIEFSSGTHTLEGTVDVTGGLIGTGGTLVVPSTLRLGAVTLTSVTVDGAGDLEAAVTFSSTFGTWRGSGAVRVLAGASGSIGGSLQGVDRVLHNAGTLAFRDNASLTLRNGSLRNEGLLLVTNGVTFTQSTTNARVELGGTLRKLGTGTLTFQSGIVNQSGRMEIAAGVISGNACDLFLRPGSGPSPVLDISTGAELRWGSGRIHVGAPDPFTGSGLLTLGSSGTLALEGPLNLGTLDVAFNASSQVTGNFTLANRAGGRFRFTGAVAIEGGVEIGGRMETAANATVRIDDRLTILAGGALDNLGIVRVREFINNGTLTGKAPEVRVTGPLRIATIEAVEEPGGDRGALPTALGSTAATLRLRWEASPGAIFHVERSADLRTWSRHTARVTEPKPGSYEALLDAGTSPIGWFRLVEE